MNTSFFGELLQTISERGRVADRPAASGATSTPQSTANLVDLCEELLSNRGEASGVALAREILALYADLTIGPRIAFFEALATRFGTDRTRIEAAHRGMARRRRPIPPRPSSTTPPSRGGRNCCAGSISRPRAPGRWSRCAASCSTRWRGATISRRSTPISSTCSRRGSTAASWCCGGSTGRRPR